MYRDSKEFRRNTDFLKASEIGQYEYCPVSWLLSRTGYEPTSASIESGIIEHENLGLNIATIQETEKTIGKMSSLVVVLLTISVLLILAGVLL